MQGMAIGDVAKRTGLPTSTIRYYEKEALLEAPSRSSGRRIYEPDVLGRIAVVKLALQSGFTIAETRLFISGFSPQTRPAARWRDLAEHKLRELDLETARIAAMRALLESSFHCDCPDLGVCEQLMAEHDRKSRSAKKTPRR